MKRKPMALAMTAALLLTTVPINTRAQKSAEARFYEPEMFKPIIIQDSPDLKIPLVVEPTPTPKPPKIAVPKPKVKIAIKQRFDRVVTGTATWYNNGSGIYGAAGPALRVGNYKGRVVQVCSNAKCITVRIVDFCGCGHGRVIDLSPNAFSILFPLSQGVGKVTVKW